MNSLFKTVTGARPIATEQQNVVPMRQTMVATQKTFVRDYELEMFIGIYPQEKAAMQKVLVNVELDVVPVSEWQRDDIKDVLSYMDIVEIINTIAAEGHINLVETFAEQIIESCLIKDGVLGATVSVEKLEILKNAKSLGVTISRQRV